MWLLCALLVASTSAAILEHAPEEPKVEPRELMSLHGRPVKFSHRRLNGDGSESEEGGYSDGQEPQGEQGAGGEENSFGGLESASDEVSGSRGGHSDSRGGYSDSGSGSRGEDEISEASQRSSSHSQKSESSGSAEYSAQSAHSAEEESEYGSEQGSEHEYEHEEEHEDEHEEEHEGEHEEEESEESEQSEESGEFNQVPHVNFEEYSESEHMQSYKKIAEDMKVYEDEYTACIREIPDSSYTEESLDECLGKNFIKVTLDLKYIILKVMAKADTKVRSIFINDCYAAAGTDERFSTACDLLERDVLDMLWNGLDFVGLMDLNKSKYIDEWGDMPEGTYEVIFNELSKLSKEFFELMDELDSHKEITILRIKTLIDDRTKLILEEAQNHPDMVEPATITHRIEISETVDNDDGSGLDFLPATQFHDGTAASRKLPGTPPQADKHNSLRSLNSGGGYNELNGANRGIVNTSRDRFSRNEQFKSMFWDRLGKAARAQAKTPFKNIHTTHYSRVAKR